MSARPEISKDRTTSGLAATAARTAARAAARTAATTAARTNGAATALPRIVVGAAILDGDRLLAARRSAPASLAGGWELPGGKVEPGETHQEALMRECFEELGVVVRIGRRVGGDWPLTPALILRVWEAVIVSGEPRPLEDHDVLRWLGPDEWFDVDWLTADLPVVHAVRTGRSAA